MVFGSRKNNLAKKINDELEDKKRGRKVILNVIYCLLHGQSSEDFIALNNLDHLFSSEVAVKNNSRFAFFEVRELVWEVLSKMIKKLFSDPDLIRDICVTLDKVTVFNIPYLVVCTYYFMEDGLHVRINSQSVSDGGG